MPVSSKIIRKRIKSVSSTKKITRTMEMVATSKLQRTQTQVIAQRPYMEALQALMAQLGGAVDSLGAFPLFERRDPIHKVLVFLVTANRGLCGGFNTNLVRKCLDHKKALEAEGYEVVLHVAGKKGIGALKYREVEMAATRLDLTDRPGFPEAESVAQTLVDAFFAFEVDRVDVVYADFISVSRQPPTVVTLLPVGAQSDEAVEGEAKPATESQLDAFIFDPSPAAILEQLGPMYVNNVMFRVLLSSVASEMLARRVAMKNATDNANEMEKSLTLQYNQARQAAITQELAEIVGGAAALE